MLDSTRIPKAAALHRAKKEVADRRSVTLRSATYPYRDLYFAISSFSAWTKASTSSSVVSKEHIQRTSPAASFQK